MTRRSDQRMTLLTTILFSSWIYIMVTWVNSVRFLIPKLSLNLLIILTFLLLVLFSFHLPNRPIFLPNSDLDFPADQPLPFHLTTFDLSLHLHTFSFFPFKSLQHPFYPPVQLLPPCPNAPIHTHSGHSYQPLLMLPNSLFVRWLEQRALSGSTFPSPHQMFLM